MSGAGRHHRLQSRASYCVLGCGEIVASRRAQPFDQVAVAGVLSGSRRGFALQDLRGVLGDGVTFVRSDPDEPTTLAYIEAQLGGGAYVIAQVFVAELVKSMRRQGTAVDEPHGPLGGTLHCVVLVEAAPSSGEVLYLDPFFGPEGQPLRLLRTELASALQSDLLIVLP